MSEPSSAQLPARPSLEQLRKQAKDLLRDRAREICRFPLRMKPAAPPEVRGEFKPIASKLPGLSVCEHLPRLATRADKYALVRSLAHRENNHLVATHHLLTGYPQPGAFFDKVASHDDWPCYSSTLAYLRPRQDGLPTGINLPNFLIEGPLTWPG